MKSYNYLILLLFLLSSACGEESTSSIVTGGSCAEVGQKVCAESYIEVLQCGNDLTWHTIEICQSAFGEFCIEAGGTAYCNGSSGTPDVDTIQLPDEDVGAQDFAPVDDDETVDEIADEIIDEDVGAQDFAPVDSDDIEQPDADKELYCGDGQVDEIYTDAKKEYANNTQTTILDSTVSESEITTPEDGTIISFNYKFHITHARSADLTVEIVSPAEKSYVVCSECTSTELQNRDETVTTFDGDSAMGVWKLKVTDGTLGNSGMIYYFRVSMDLHIFISGEECDDGNDIDTDDCTNSCKTPVCGDGVVWDGHEACDGVNDGSYGNCNADCLALANHCGDGAITDSEICDDGTDNGLYNQCGLDCAGIGNHCGDGTITDSEICDDGSDNGSYNHCLSDCSGVGPSCGDGDHIQLSFADAVVTLSCDEGYGETTQDISGNSNNGTLDGATWGAGKFHNGLAFNGDDSVTWVYADGVPADNFTMMAWVQVTQTHEIDGQSTSGVGGIAGQHYLFGANVDMGAASGAGVSVGTNGISVYEHAGSYMPALAVYNGTLGTDWNHVAVTYTNKLPQIYLNGVLVTTGLTSPRTAVYAPTRAGGGSYGNISGAVDEVRIVARALSAAEIAEAAAFISYEACDDGESNGTYGHCSADCSEGSLRCGDGIVTTPEEFCDDGDENGGYGKCATDCSALGPHCGDGVLDDVYGDGDKNYANETDYTTSSWISTIYSDIAVAESGEINSVSYTIDAGNDYYYLTVTLIAPDATEHVICAYPGGCNAANITNATATVPSFAEREMNGTWRLKLYSRNTGSYGVTSKIRSFRLTINTYTYLYTEPCDEGADNGLYGHCSLDCSEVSLHCGDGIVTTPDEVCDDGDKNGGYDKCGVDCMGIGHYCGDGIIDEVYDDIDANYANETDYSTSSWISTVYSNIVVPDSGTVNSFSYTIDIDGTYSYLRVDLIAPDATEHNICSYYGGCTLAKLNDATAAIATFNGKSLAGTWKMKVYNSDSSYGGIASIRYFRMSINRHTHIFTEECDDNNTTAGDGCDGSCAVE